MFQDRLRRKALEDQKKSKARSSRLRSVSRPEVVYQHEMVTAVRLSKQIQFNYKRGNTAELKPDQHGVVDREFLCRELDKIAGNLVPYARRGDGKGRIRHQIQDPVIRAAMGGMNIQQISGGKATLSVPHPDFHEVFPVLSYSTSTSNSKMSHLRAA